MGATAQANDALSNPQQIPPQAMPGTAEYVVALAPTPYLYLQEAPHG